MEPFEYTPYSEVAHLPHVVVDGQGQKSTTLTLSHWPHSGTPLEFKADTSAESVLKLLEGEDPQAYTKGTRLVTNNHYDVDGLVAMWALMNPVQAGEHRDLLIDLASAGDFGVYKNDHTAQVLFILQSLADHPSLRTSLANKSFAEIAAILYQFLLPQLQMAIERTEKNASFWEKEFTRLKQSEAMLESGEARLTELKSVDMAVVESDQPLHPLALHSATPASRIVILAGNVYTLTYRYESWVQFMSRPIAPRIDLKPLLPLLNEKEQVRTHTWSFDDLSSITPKLWLRDPYGMATGSNIDPDTFVATVMGYLGSKQAEAAKHWDPYDLGATPLRSESAVS